ncbi:MAG: hypothetical protein V8Q30_08260 [Acutalibacteraceae bacterium]
MNKIFATVLAAVMTVSLTSVAFADTTKDMGFVLGYKTDATGNGATVYADQDDDGKYDDDTLAGLKNLEAGSKIYIPILKWDDKNSRLQCGQRRADSAHQQRHQGLQGLCQLEGRQPG